MLIDGLDEVARGVAYVVGGGIFVNGLDELYVDANYWLRGLYRQRKHFMSLDALRVVPKKRIAILVPAWHEAEVIEQMIASNVRRVDYPTDHYDVFCGTYRNDPQTQARVDAAARTMGNVHKVVVPHDGPTSKADCLNWVYRGVVEEEERTGRRFEILLMHDAEDVIHPAALRLYSALIPPNDFVQTPVFSLPLPSHRIVSSTYIDEFAEHHLKEMLVRQAIGGIVPSAGVGTAFARDAFEEIAVARGREPFNTESLTEDYEIGLRLRLAGKRMRFACCGLATTGQPTEVIATREYFPRELRASIKQRSRWILGIALQTWAQVGWRGPPAVRYCLWRDRKALATNMLQLLAYLLVAYVATRPLLTHDAHSFSAEYLAAQHPFLWWLLTINLGVTMWRAGMKARFVGWLYGPWHALLSVPRLVLGNLIGILATARAIAQFARHRVTGKPLRWVKTAHTFPTDPTGGLSPATGRSSHVQP